jgi:hypothetical protein
LVRRWPLRHRKKGVQGVGKTKRGKGTKIIGLADRAVLPIAWSVSSASPHKITLVEPTLETIFITESPKRLIGDKAYDSDPLDEKLAENGLKLITSHRSNQKEREHHQDSYTGINIFCFSSLSSFVPDSLWPALFTDLVESQAGIRSSSGKLHYRLRSPGP